MTILPFDDRDGHIWVNGEMVPWRDAKLHILSHGLHYGGSVFEGERVYDDQIFKIKEHGKRLHKSAELLDFEIPFSADVLDEAAKEIVAKQGVKNGYVRRFAWRGSEMMAIAAQQNTIHVAIATWSWPNLFAGDAKEKGIRMVTADWKRPSPETAPCQSKAAGLYMICTMSKHKAQNAGYDDAMMLDWRGYVAEATGANIFFVMDGAVHTPTADCFLNGLTRQTVMGLIKDRGLELVERHIMPDEIGKATEVFLTGSAAEVTPVQCIDDHNYVVGDITKQVMQDYRDLVYTKVSDY